MKLGEGNNEIICWWNRSETEHYFQCLYLIWYLFTNNYYYKIAILASLKSYEHEIFFYMPLSEKY